MLIEYAVEPKALASSWQNFRYIFEKFGYDTGRVISRFPKNWTREVYKAAESLPPMEKKMVEVALERGKSSRLVRAARTYNPAMSDWCSNALAEHRRSPFRGIVAEQNPANVPFILVPSDFDESHPLMQVDRDKVVSRDVASLFSVLEPLLRYASRLVFVDAYFDPFNQKYQTIFRACFEFLSKHNSEAMSEIHFTDRKVDTNSIAREWPTKARLFMPAGVKATLHCWRQKAGGEDFHARYLGTDVGGLSIDAGFSVEGGHQTTNVQLMTLALLKMRLRQLDANAGVYDLVSPIIEVDGGGGVRRL